MTKVNKLLQISVLLLILLSTITVNAEEINLLADSVIDKNNNYNQVLVQNGEFETYPDKGDYSPTEGNDWKTTSTIKDNQGYFKINKQVDDNLKLRYGISSSKGNFLEINNSTVYQTIKTNPNELIMWSIYHGTNNKLSENQDLLVTIGKKNDENSQLEDNSIILDSTYYSSAGILGNNSSSLNTSPSDLENLSITPNNEWINDIESWKLVKGIYLVPENQNETVLSFKNEDDTKIQTHYIDSVELKTLLGNLKIDTNKGKNYVILTGYYPKIIENQGKNLEYKIVDKKGVNCISGTIDMNSLTDSYFSVEIPVSDISNDVYTIEINHEDYKKAALKVNFSLNKIVDTNEKLETEIEKNDKVAGIILKISIVFVVVSLILLANKGIKIIKERQEIYKLNQKK